MKTTRRLLTVLLALMLMVSAFAVTAHAEDEMDTSPYLCFSWLDNNGDGWYENTDRDWYNDNRGFSTIPQQDHWQVYYYAVWNGSEWKYTAIDPSKLVVENLTVTPLRDMPEESTMGANSHCFCLVRANDWGNASVRYTMDDGTVLTMNVEVRRNEDGFYNSVTLNNNTYITEYRIDPFAKENSFYFGFQSTFWTLKDAQLIGEGAERATMQKVRNNLYKITLDPDYVRDCWNLDPFRLELEITVYNEDDTENYWEENWFPGIDCNPIWMHEMEQLALLRINGSEYTLVEGGWIRGYDEQMENEDGDTWYEWRNEIADLPEGVSYDYQTNTLTLQNADLNKLELLYSWYDQQSGASGTHLPNENLTIHLVGENTIIQDTDWAVRLGDNVKATITGSGSLHVKATNNNPQNEWGYYSYPAFSVDNGADLTIGGNAKVTVEIAGEALEGNEEQNQPAHLIALHCSDRNLTLCENAVLTTVVPDGAMSSGNTPNPDDPWNFPGGYTGIGIGASLTIKDNATLNTTTLKFHDLWAWDEEKQEDYLVGGSSFIMEGGTLNLAALAEKSITEKWEWDEEKQENVYLGYSDWYHCRALGLFSSLGQHKISGGIINILAAPTQEQYETGAHAGGIEAVAGTLDITGGTINISISGTGTGLAAGDWDESMNGKVSMTGGEIYITGNRTSLDVNPYGVMDLQGGKLHIENGSIQLSDRREWNEETETDDILSTGSLTINGAEVTIDQGTMYSSGNLTINSGFLRIKYARGSEVDAEEWMVLCGNDGSITVNGGELTLEGTDVDTVLYTGNSFRQTGGIVNLSSTVSDAWKEEVVNRHEGDINWEPTPYTVDLYSSMTIDGGVMNLKGYHGMIGNPGSNLALNNGELNISATMQGLANIGGEITLNDGSLSIEISGRRRNFIGAEDKTFSLMVGDALIVERELRDDIPAKLTVNGGDHVLKAVRNEGSMAATSGIYTYLGDISINGGSFMIQADTAIVTSSETERNSCFTFADNMRILSLADGHALQLLEYTYHPVKMDENHNPILDENGNYVYDESVTCYQYWMEEDNVMSKDDEVADYSDLVLITSENCGDNAVWSYDVDSKTLTVSGEGTMYGYTGEPATGIAPWYWFKENGLVKTLVLEEGITSIGDYAFFGQGGIESSVGVQVASIGTKAFDADAKLTVVCASAAAEYAADNGLNATVLHQYVNGKCSRCGGQLESPFTDVPANAFYFDPVQWAVENGITTGMDAAHFAPITECNRAQVVTFLWRAAGSPEPTTTENPFEDVPTNAFYYKAVLWAVENQITNGLSDTEFGPSALCNRAQVVTFLWRAQSSPESNADISFTDVENGKYYTTAVAWAVENGITNGISDTEFGVGTICNRAQVVTFLYRAFVN